MAIAVMSQVWARAQVSGGELLVLLALADFANDVGEAWPSVPTLAQRARLSRRRVQEVLRALEAAHLIADVGTTRHGTRCYRLRLDTLGGAETAPPRDAETAPPGARPTARGGAVDRTGGARPTAPNPSLNHHEPSPPPAGGAAHRVVGVDIPAVTRSVERGDLLGIARAFGAQVDLSRRPEWTRDAAGLTLAAVVAIFDRSTREGQPIRQPSGFRRAREAWTSIPKAERTTIGRDTCASYGIPLPEAPTTPDQPNHSDTEAPTAAAP